MIDSDYIRGYTPYDITEINGVMYSVYSTSTISGELMQDLATWYGQSIMLDICAGLSMDIGDISKCPYCDADYSTEVTINSAIWREYRCGSAAYNNIEQRIVGITNQTDACSRRKLYMEPEDII